MLCKIELEKKEEDEVDEQYVEGGAGAAGTICQGITGAIREVDNWSWRYAACKEEEARDYNQRNHTGEQTCKQLVTLAPMMLV